LSTPNEPTTENSAGLGIGWKAAIGVAAILIIGGLLYGFGAGQPAASNQNTPAPAGGTPAAATLTPAEATAQAAPDSAKAQFELGNSYYEAGRLDHAAAAYQNTIALDPNYQAAYANLGVVYYQLQNFDLAAAQYEKAIELDPADGEVAYNLGVLYLQQALSNQPQSSDSALLQKAITQLQHAQEISPNLAEPYFSLGVAYWASTQPDKAAQAFQSFLSFDQNQDVRARQEAERYLQLIQSQTPSP
jgi:tetratricopeptide (TPR) repeat protein